MYKTSKPYPYLPEGKTFLYVPLNNEYIRLGEQLAKSIKEKFPLATVTASVIVKDGKVLGQGINSPMHKSFCIRTALASASGEGYELCPRFCHSSNHSEPQAIKNVNENGFSAKGADLYLYGHWWSCKPCWDKMLAAGINNVFLVEGATEMFYSAYSFKGEPNKQVKVFIDGNLPAGIETKLERVKIFVEKDAGKADYVLKPDNAISEIEFLMKLQKELEDSKIYES